MPTPSAAPGRRRAGVAKAGARRTYRHDVTLKHYAEGIVTRLMSERRCGASEALNAIVTEWELLRRVRAAQDHRHDTYNDVNAMSLNLQAALQTHGREREQAVRLHAESATMVMRRTALVTAL